MNKSQVCREIVAARAAYRAPVTPSTMGTNPAMRAEPTKAPVGAVRNRRAVKMTATQTNSEGRTSEWSRSANYWTNPGWSA